MKHVCVVVPTYNESENVKQILDSIFMKAKTKDYYLRVVIVDDKSPDKTAEIALAHAEKKQYDVQVVSGNKNGLGKAYIRGFEFVKKHNLGDVIVMMDADMSHDAAEIPGFIGQIDKVDLIIGSRYVSGGMIPGEWPVMRVINSRVARFVSRFVGGLSKSVSDPAAGFRVFELSTLDKYDIIEKSKTSGYVFMVSMTNGFLKNNLEVLELPILFKDRTHGESKIRASDILEYFLYSYNMNNNSPFKRTVQATLEWAVIALVFLAVQSYSKAAGFPGPLGILISAQAAVVAIIGLKWKSFGWVTQLKFASGRVARLRRALKEFFLFDLTLSVSLLAFSLVLGSGYVVKFVEHLILFGIAALSIMVYRRVILPALGSR